MAGFPQRTATALLIGLVIALIMIRQNLRSDSRDQAQVVPARAGEETVDVVIVGAGVSGLSAALELGRAGVDVLVVDMSSVFGGHAVMSQGGLSIVDSPLQRSLGLEDSPDLAYGDFIRWGEDANEPWVRYYVDHSRVDIYDWLVELGVEFSSVERAPGNSVDRFHQPAGRGIGLVTPIYKACLELDNVRFRWNHQAVRLAPHGDQLEVTSRDLRAGDESTVIANDVILATGGFQSNLEMVRQYWPQELRFPKKILAGSGRNSVGHGHRLAAQLGGKLDKMDHQWNYFTGIPDPRHPESERGLSAANMHGVIVNSRGERFANLHAWAKEVMPKLFQQDEATLWFVFDESIREKFVVSGSEWAEFDKVDRLILQNESLVKKAATLDELATRTGLPAGSLTKTVQRYNQLVESGRDDDFDRFGPTKTEYNNTASPKLQTPPFFAMQAYPLTRKSMGGVAIDLQCRVIDGRGRPIPHLYAVGELTGLAGVNGKAALEGTFLGPCVLTGRVAARAIADNRTNRNQVAASPSDECLDCHQIVDEIARRRPGHWHFEESHAIAVERKTDCLNCHRELAPYREDHHRIDPTSLTKSCVYCHQTLPE